MGARSIDAASVRTDKREFFTFLAPHMVPSLDAELEPLNPLYDYLLHPGQRVLDLGCGSGEDALAIAERVGPEGGVVGLDITPALIDGARALAHHHGRRNVEFRVIESEVDLGVPVASFDVAICAFTLMYMPDPTAALREIHTALKPGGRAAVTTLAALERCPFFAIPSEIIERHLGHPPLDPLAPGTFAIGSHEALERIFRAAGFSAIETAVTEMSVETESPESYWTFMTTGSPAAPVLASLSEEVRQAIHDDVVHTLGAMFPDGTVTLGGEVLFAVGTKVS